MAARPLETAKIRPRVIAWLLDGVSEGDIAAKLRRCRPRIDVTPQAIHNFKKRHADVLEAKTEAIETAVVEATVGVVIADKAERLKKLQGIYDRYEAVLEQRGPLAKEPKWVTTYLNVGKEKPTGPKGGDVPAKEVDGEFLIPMGTILVEVEKVDKALADVLTGILSQVADEQGELPQRGVNLSFTDNRSVNVVSLEGISDDDRRRLYELAVRRGS